VSKTAIDDAKLFGRGKFDSLISLWLSRRQAIKWNQGNERIDNPLQKAIVAWRHTITIVRTLVGTERV